MLYSKTRVGDICKIISSGGTPKRSEAGYYGGKINWIKTQELNDCYIFDTEEKITELGINNSSAKVFPAETISMAMYGATVAKLGIMKVPCSTNQACCNMVANETEMLHMFLYYALLNERDSIKRKATGAAQQNISVSIISNYMIPKPPIKTQTKIVMILQTLDDKIRNNNKHCDLLQEKLQTIYKSWFIDFNYPGATGETLGSIPIDWIESNVFDNVTEVREKNRDNLDYPVLSVVKEGEFKLSDDVFMKQVYSKSLTNYKTVRRNQVGYNPARANIGSIAMLTDFDIGLVSPVYVVFEMKDTITPTFFYYYMKQPMFAEGIKHHAIGTTRQNFPFEAFKMFPMIIPPMELQKRFEEIAKPIEQKISKLKEENAVLAEIRDTLLPKLMSGELPVEVGEA